MTTFEALMSSAMQVKTLEQCGYVLGCINTEYAHDFITKAEYDAVFRLVIEKRERLI